METYSSQLSAEERNCYRQIVNNIESFKSEWIFQNVSFKYKGKEFTEIYCSGYLHRSQLSTGSGSNKKYMNSSKLHIDLHFTNGDYTVGIASNDATNRTAWQSSSSSYPSYPTGLDLSTKDIILSFDTAPTGSFLTWLNEHATLIPTTK